MSGEATALLIPAASAIRRHRRARARRGVVAVAGLGGVAGALFVATLATGSSGLSPVDVAASLLGVGQSAGADFIVHELRLPLAAAALCVGLALGVAGTLFQQLLGNPLAAPELVGISAGASLAAIVGLVLFAWGGYVIALAALLGAFASAALIYAIAWRGGIQGYRLILVGIGVSELLLSLVAYLVARAEIQDAREAMHWLVGSIGQSGPAELRALILALAVLVPLALILDRTLRAVQLGDEQARGLGVRVESVRLGLIGVAVALVAFATAVAGPIAFVALVAGPVALRLVGPGVTGILAAGLTGAAIVLAADLIARQLAPIALPTGVVTGAVGAPYLLWLLATLNREGRAA